METWQGMTMQTLDAPWRRWFEIPDKFTGLVVLTVEPNSEAEKLGVQRGDVLVNINNQYDLFSLDDLRKVKSNMEKENPFLLQTYRLVKKHWQPRRVQF